MRLVLHLIGGSALILTKTIDRGPFILDPALDAARCVRFGSTEASL